MITTAELEELIQDAGDIIERARFEHEPKRSFLLFSGGNDSLVLLDVIAGLGMTDEVVHINTGIGIPQTNEFARKIGSSYGLPFSEWQPPVPFEELCLNLPVLDGLPGPGVHHIIYSRLKERCVEALLRHHRTKNGERFLLLTGVRNAESKRRMGYKDPINRKGGQVWVNPLLHWPNEAMAEYRTLHALPVNEVAANLHMSGECLCGAMADQGPEREEREMIRFFYPEFDARLTDIEQQCKAAGRTYTEWGVKRSRYVPVDKEVQGELCQSCEFRVPEPEPEPEKDLRPVGHPAKFSDSVLRRVVDLYDEWGWPQRMLDPFAGVGKVHRITEGRSTQSVGVELEPEWAVQHPATIVGNALCLPFPDGSFDSMCTSPCYGNRLADHHVAKDGSRRLSYRHVLGRALHDDSSAKLQWGAKYRAFHEAAWSEALRVLSSDATILINCSNHIRGGVEQLVTEWHLAWFLDHGCAVLDLNMVKTPRLRYGANYKVRANYENTFLLRRVAPVVVPDDIRDEEVPSDEHSGATPNGRRDVDLMDTAKGH